MSGEFVTGLRCEASKKGSSQMHVLLHRRRPDPEWSGSDLIPPSRCGGVVCSVATSSDRSVDVYTDISEFGYGGGNA